MSAQLEEIVQKLSELKVLDLVKLKTLLEETWGVKAAAAVAVAAPAAAGAAAPAEEAATEFNIQLKEVPADKKLNVIKTLREITGLGLKEAKDLADNPAGKFVKEKVSKADAEAVKKKLEEAGAVVAVLPA